MSDMNEKLKPCPFCKDTKIITPGSEFLCGHRDAMEIYGNSEDWNTRPIEDALRAELSRQATAYESTIADRERDRDKYQRRTLLIPDAWHVAFMWGRESCGKSVTTTYVAELMDEWLAEQEPH